MIIGITGTLGSGKGTIVDYLVKNKDFKHFSVRAFLVEEILRRKMPVNRDSMTLVGNDLRKKIRAGLFGRITLPARKILRDKLRH